jgi:ribosomal protein S18 acetylase RimI-like enzyme
MSSGPETVPAETGAAVGGLANPVWAALRSRHAHLAVAEGGALRYHPDVAPFVGLPDRPEPGDWADLAALLHRTGGGALAGAGPDLPDGWAAEHRIAVTALAGVQLTGAGFAAGSTADPEAVELGPADVADMVDLTRRTEPGPFRPRTVELGGYLGIRRDGKLAAMAGHRMSFPAGAGGWVEISAVCTDPDFRGQGLATRLMRLITARARSRGDEVFLHAAAANTAAIGLYQHLGFVLSAEVTITILTPESHPAPPLH